MAVYGIGLDLVRIDRLHKAVSRWGNRFEERVFTESELAACAQRRDRISCLAMRFAAKEAFAKALGTGMRAPLFWRDIEVQSNALGKPEIVLSSRALSLCHEHGILSWKLSLTDDGAYGAAIVIMEC